MFEKLKYAYVKARYSKHYKITAAELDWLGGCVEALGRAVHTVCCGRIDDLSAKADRQSLPTVTNLI